jgi:maltooligosyltrehalose trehalohydrolase
LVLDDRVVGMEGEGGWFSTAVDALAPGTRYRYRLDGAGALPDPASLSQPDGVHGASAVVDLGFAWTDAGWQGLDLRDHVIYEMHVGTFTEEGTFDAASARLGHLEALGITAVEVMPVAQFPGEHNWGYDGVDLYAVQQSYGGPRGLQRFVDACHGAGVAVLLDVVYNHLGPEGNHLHAYGPYFTDRYRTPWGDAVNLDGPGSDTVRQFLIENALMWITDFHVDGLRLDAVHAMFDHTAQPFLGMLTRACHTRAGELGRRVHVFVENADNDPRLMKPSRLGGFDVDAAWNDDFHHALHVTLTGESEGYYTDFAGGPADLATAIDAGYVVAGKYSPFRERRHGASSADLPRSSLVVFGQNHDQVGNRSRGDRLSTLADPARLRLAAALVLLSPWVPLLFMGEEWAEVRPFLYFVDHSDPTLLDGVRRGRAEEFADLVGQGERLPDPASPDTRHRSVLDWASISSPTHAAVLDLYTTLIHIRKTHPSITDPRPETHHVTRDGTLVTLLGDGARPATVSLFNVGETVATVALPPSRWRRLLPGEDPPRGAPEPAGNRLPPWGFALYVED